MEWITNAALFLVISLQAGAPPEPGEVLSLPPDLVKLADEKIAARAQSPERRLDLLIDFIADSNGLNFSYRSDPTHTVGETFDQSEGNCLSYTLMFIEPGPPTRPERVSTRGSGSAGLAGPRPDGV